jgi:Fur family transcriptional regulator, peroxide stress response regulator
LNIRNSKQRTRILELLKSTGSHPTATWLYDKMKDEFPNLSLGTVYRNLNILIEQGLISKIDFGSTFDRYDAKIERHYHFICEKCDSITDLSMPVMDELDKKVISKTGFKVKRHRIEFYGLCNNCKE